MRLALAALALALLLPAPSLAGRSAAELEALRRELCATCKSPVEVSVPVVTSGSGGVGDGGTMPARPDEVSIQDFRSVLRMEESWPRFEPCGLDDEYLDGLFQQAIDELCKGNDEKFQQLLDIALDQVEEVCGDTHPAAGERLGKFARSLWSAGQGATAVGYAERALHNAEQSHGAAAARTRYALRDLAFYTRHTQGDAAARALMDDALTRYAAVLEPDDPGLLQLRFDLAERASRDLRSPSRAGALLDEVTPAMHLALADDPVALASFERASAAILDRAGRTADAEQAYLRAYRGLVAGVGAGHSEVGKLLLELAISYEGTSRWEEARLAAERALAILDEFAGYPDYVDGERREAAERLLGYLEQLGDSDAAAALAMRLID